MKSALMKVKKSGLRAGVGMVLVLGLAVAGQAEPAGRVGRAIVAAMTPGATARYPDKTAHDYPQGQLALREGMALSELHTIDTDSQGRLCLVLTPGALMCVRPSSSVKIDRLEQMTDGLPETGKDLQRRIELTVASGGFLMHAEPPSSNMTIRVVSPVCTLTASGGEFVLMQDKGDWVVCSYRSGVTVTTGEGSQVLDEGKVLRLTRDSSGKITAKQEEVRVDHYRSRFDVCLEFFPELDKLVFLPSGVDANRLQGWIGTWGGIIMVGDPMFWSDVTPSQRMSQIPVELKTPSDAGHGGDGGRWSRELIWNWYRNAGVIRGVNYVPRTAVNAVELWQADTFNANAIDEELKWANEAGFNSVRVVLSYPVWSNDPQGFKSRMSKFIELAKSHHLTVVPVLFDDMNVAGREPALGKQPDPVPGMHNSQWTPNPGQKTAGDPAARRNLEAYVRDITGTFYRDQRILFWDLYNMPGSGGMGEKSLALLESTFRWARNSKTRQPLTAATWGDASDPMSARLMELSDLVTFQSFSSPIIIQAHLTASEAQKRPIVCTDWLKRQAGCTFSDVLPVLAQKQAGWYSGGLVRGRTQLYIPDDRKVEGSEPTVWQQDLLWPDGKPYDRKEIDLIKAFNFSK